MGGVSFFDIKRVVNKIIDPSDFAREFELDVFLVGDPKSFLQEFSIQFFKGLPIYKTQKDRNFPDHDPRFVSEVSFGNYTAAKGSGSSKQEATTLAAEALISALKSSSDKKFGLFQNQRIGDIYKAQLCITSQWKPSRQQLADAAAWKSSNQVFSDIPTSDVAKSFLAVPSYGGSACPHCGSVSAHVGSYVFEVAIQSCDSSIDSRTRLKVISLKIDEFFKISEGLQSIARGHVRQGNRKNIDIAQSLAFEKHLINADLALSQLRNFLTETLDDYPHLSARHSDIIEWVESMRLDENYDPAITYTQILQEYAAAGGSMY